MWCVLVSMYVIPPTYISTLNSNITVICTLLSILVKVFIGKYPCFWRLCRNKANLYELSETSFPTSFTSKTFFTINSDIIETYIIWSIFIKNFIRKYLFSWTFWGNKLCGTYLCMYAGYFIISNALLLYIYISASFASLSSSMPQYLII